MARPATGSPRWNPKTACWEARVSITGLGREPVPMKGIPKCTSDIPTSPSKCACASCAQARRVAQLISDRARREGRVPAETAETVSEWFERYFRWRKTRPRAESVEDSRGRFRKWVEPKLGTVPMTRVTTAMLEEFVSFLDDQVGEEIIAAKTAQNIFGLLTVGFAAATKSKEKTLRVLDKNPAEGVEGPDDGTTKQKPFLFPAEVVKLLTGEGKTGISVERRHVYAVAIYTAMRQGELRALRVRDVDLETMQITVARQMKSGVEKERTKTGRARIVQIEPNLVPLLRVLMRGKKPDDRLLSVGAHNRCASNLREDLLAAGCTREALHVDKKDPMRARMKFHNLRDTCLTHMAVRRDPPQDVQWRAGHTTPAMTEAYITNARYAAGKSFGEPLPPLPPSLLVELPPEGATGNWAGIGLLDQEHPQNADETVEAPGIEVCKSTFRNGARSLVFRL